MRIDEDKFLELLSAHEIARKAADEWDAIAPVGLTARQRRKEEKLHRAVEDTYAKLWEYVSTASKPAIDFVEQTAQLLTLEDCFNTDPQEYEDVDEMRSDLSDDRLLDEFAALEGLIEQARDIRDGVKS